MIPEMAADVITSVVALRVADDKVLLLVAAVEADVEGLMPSAVLANAVSVTIEGSEGSRLATLAVLEVDGDERLDSAGTAVLVGAGVDAAIIPMVIGNAGACARMPSAVANAEDNASLLKTFAHGVGQTVPGILEVFEHVNNRVVKALVSENGGIPLEAAADVIAEVLVPLAVLVNVVSVTVEGSGVPENVAPAALVVLDAERDELLDSAGAEAWAGTGVVDAMIPVMLDHVDARAIVPIAVADEDAPPPKTCVNGVGGVVPVIPEMAADVNTSVVASRVAEDEVLLLEAADNVDGTGLVPSAVLVNAVSTTFEGSGMLKFATLAVLEVDGDELLDSAGSAVLVGTGAVVVMIPVVIGHVDTCGRVPTAGADADDNAPLLQTFADGVGETVSVILDMDQPRWRL